MRTLRHSPFFSAIAIGILAISIGAAAAVLSAFHALLLQPLPFRDAQDLVSIEGILRDRPGAGTGWADIEDWKRGASSLTGVAGCATRTWGLALQHGEQVSVVLSCQVTPGFLEVFGVSPLIGRPMAEADVASAQRQVWLSHRLWTERFGGDPRVTSGTLILNDDTGNIAGVLPAGFRYSDSGREPDLYIILDHKDYGRQRSGGALNGVARLKDGFSAAAAEAQLNSLIRNNPANRDYAVRLRPLKQAWAGSYREPMIAFLAAAVLLLLIGCLNAGTLWLARSMDQGKDAAVRMALGAPARRLLREQLFQTLTLSVLGGVLGVVVARLLLNILNNAPRFMPRLPLLDPVELNPLVFSGVALACIMAAIGFALLPMAALRRADFLTVIRGGSQRTTSHGATAWRRALVVMQIALSTVLLGNALLLGRSFQKLLAIDPGFDPENVLLFGIGIPESRYSTDARMAAFHQTLQEKLRRLTGVDSVAAVAGLPMGGRSARTSIVMPEYFDVLRIPLKTGRKFTPADQIGRPPVCIINETMARAQFPDREPIGQRILPNWRNTSYPRGTEWIVIGIAGDTRQGSLDQAVQPQVYGHVAQFPTEGIHYVIRTNRTSADLTPFVREAISSIDPSLERITLRPMTERLDGTLRERRVALVLLAGFTSLAVLLSMAGVGGLLSFLATQRRREFGIRAALGETPSRLALGVLGQAANLAAIGLMIGLPAAAAAARLIRHQLYDATISDPAVIAAGSGLIVILSIGASLAPAIRTARLDPARVLRDS